MTIAEFPQLAAAIAILLSVTIRWIRAGASWDAVEEGRANAQTLRDLTGILEYDRLQETFGPPRMEDGVFPVTRNKVLSERTGIGYLIGDRWLDGGSALIACVVLLPIWPIWGTRWWLDTLIACVAIYQAAGWFTLLTVMKRR